MYQNIARKMMFEMYNIMVSFFFCTMIHSISISMRLIVKTAVHQPQRNESRFHAFEYWIKHVRR